MTDYVNAALFVYTEDSRHLVEQLQNNAYSTEISPISVESLLQDPQARLENVKHIVVAGSLASIKSILSLAMQYEFSVGLVPLESQKTLIKSLDLPKAVDEAIELALRRDAQPMDLILCNGKILLFKASIGRVPLLDSSGNRALIDLLREALKKFIGIKLLRFVFSTAHEKTINTIASGCMIIQIHKGSLASRLIQSDSSVRDGAISLIITSPFSIVEYLRFLLQSRSKSSGQKALPNGIGFIKSNQIDIDAEIELDVFIDGTSETHTPVHCETIPDAVRLNAGVLLEEFESCLYRYATTQGSTRHTSYF
jgi:diacylglycerol kinase family enzyme